MYHFVVIFFYLCLSVLLLCPSVQSNDNRRVIVPQIDPSSPPSIVWTETIDVKNLKLAVLSYRLISTSMSDAKWATETLRRAGIIEDSSSSSCRATFFLLNAGGGVIDYQHARGSPIIKKQYSHIRMKFERADIHALPEHNEPFHEICTYLIGQGYAHMVCPITDEFHCENLAEFRHEITMTDFVDQERLIEGIPNSLKFLIEAQHIRKASFIHKHAVNPSSGQQKRRSKSERVYGVVAHIGLKNEATSIQVEAWIRFHMKRGFKMFLFDRYAFHRDIVAHSVVPYVGTIDIDFEQPYVDPSKGSEGQKKTLNNLGPIPINDAKAYRKRRSKRMQHKIVYYTVPEKNKNMNDVSIRPGELVYANFTPYELIRRTGPHGSLLVPYFDKPATFLYVAHENPHLEMVFMLDVDEFLDCSDNIDTILTSHPEYQSIDELRVPRRVIPTTMTFEQCSKLKNCTYSDIWDNKYRWQKFDKVGVRPLEIPDISIHGTQTPHYEKCNYPNNHTTNHMPAWDCSVEHLNPNYFGPNIKARSVVKYFEKNRGPWQWGLHKDPDTKKLKRSLFPLLSHQHAYMYKDPLPRRGAGYNKKGVMTAGSLSSLYDDVRSSLTENELKSKSR